MVAVGLIGGLLLARDSLQARDAQLTSFQRAGDGRAIVVTVLMGVGEELIGSRTVEDTKTVRVTIRVRRYSGSVPAVALLYPVTVRLGALLGDRMVVDGVGNPVPDLGDYTPPRPTPTR